MMRSAVWVVGVGLALVMVGWLAAVPVHAQTVTVAPGDAGAAAVVLADLEGATDRDAQQLREAAAELQLHVRLITGAQMPILEAGDAAAAGAYRFHIGEAPAGVDDALAPQEARWVVTPEAAYLWGGSAVTGYTTSDAVYDFLERQLGVTWVQPGPEGIAYEQRPTLELTVGEGRWAPRLMFRKIRQAFRRRAKEIPTPPRFEAFPEFWPAMEEINQWADEDVQWQRRMRMGGSRPGGGHAFSEWWDRFGQSHPEYFALTKTGRREPVSLGDPEKTNAFVKVCASNPAVVAQLVADWLPRQERVEYVNAGVNDGTENFCVCQDCRALDVHTPAEQALVEQNQFVFPGGGDYVSLTDRYVYLANELAREVRKHRADAKVTMYAYLTTLNPPRERRLEPNVVVQIVPYVIPLDEDLTRELIGGWHAAGATQVSFRPNYHTKYHTLPIPMGYEKEMYDVFQVAVENGCIAADYDSLTGLWNIAGMADYILARAMAEPERSFEHWEDRYCATYGEAAEDVKAYFRYWRHQVWDRRIKPNIEHLARVGRYGNVARGIAWSIRAQYRGSYDPPVGDYYYTAADFDRTDELLARAMQKDLPPHTRERLRQLVLANQHARLEHDAIALQDNAGYAAAQKLLAFRIQHRDDMRMAWTGVFYIEDAWGDLAQLEVVRELEQYPLPWFKTPLQWHFKPDPNDQGVDEAWYRSRADDIADWPTIRVNVPWSNTYESPHVELKKMLKTYDGVGWYALRLNTPSELRGREVLLHFGAVSDACTLYVNGQRAGHHPAEGQTNDGPFALRIDPFINWDAPAQHVMVRVEDHGGIGGIHGHPWVVSRKPTQ